MISWSYVVSIIQMHLLFKNFLIIFCIFRDFFLLFFQNCLTIYYDYKSSLNLKDIIRILLVNFPELILLPIVLIVLFDHIDSFIWCFIFTSSVLFSRVFIFINEWRTKLINIGKFYGFLL